MRERGRRGNWVGSGRINGFIGSGIGLEREVGSVGPNWMGCLARKWRGFGLKWADN